MTENLALKNKRLRDRYCKENSMPEIIETLRKENASKLWDKLKINWNLADWDYYFKLKKQ